MMTLLQNPRFPDENVMPWVGAVNGLNHSPAGKSHMFRKQDLS
jgi:hypothetical protein